jgi:rubrerythrin
VFPYTTQKDGILTAKKKSFLDKVATKTTNKLADKVASGIVRSITTKPKSRDSGNSTVAKSTSTKRGTAKKEAADKPDADTMAMRYNTKRCPECQALCFNSPAVCPYCDADLKSVKPLTPKEFDELSE